MNKQEKYSPQIKDVSQVAHRCMASIFAHLEGLLDHPSSAVRGAGVCLIKDFAAGTLPPATSAVQKEVARQLFIRLAAETDPFLHELIVRELALLLEPDCESHLAHLDPSEN